MSNDFTFTEETEEEISEILLRPFYGLLKNRITRMHEKDATRIRQLTARVKKRFEYINDLGYEEIGIKLRDIERYEVLINELKALMGNIIFVTPALKGNLAKRKWHLWEYLPKPANEDLKKNRFNKDARTGKTSTILVDKFYLEFKEALERIIKIIKEKYPFEPETYLSHFLEKAYEQNRELFIFLGFRTLPDWEHFTHNVFRDAKKVKDKNEYFIEKYLEIEEKLQG